MGQASSKPLSQYSANDISHHVNKLGAKYANYTEEIEDNGIHGQFLQSLSEEEFVETLEDLGVTSRLHVRFLTKEWAKAKEEEEEATAHTYASTTNLSSSERLGDEDETVVSMEETIRSLDSMTRKSLGILPPALLCHSPKQQHQQPPQPRVVVDPIQAAAKYEVTHKTSDDELNAFSRVADRVFDECGSQVLYAGVHLIDPTGYTTLGSKYSLAHDRSKTGKTRHHGDIHSICHQSILKANGGSSVVLQQIPAAFLEEAPEIFGTQVDTPLPYYHGHVIREQSTGARIGIVCAICPHELSTDRLDLLKQVAYETASLLKQRELFIQRNKMLREQIHYADPHSPQDTNYLEDPHHHQSVSEISQSGADHHHGGDVANNYAMSRFLSDISSTSSSSQYGGGNRAAALPPPLATPRKPIAPGDTIVLEAHGPVPAVTQSQIDGRPARFPYPEELAQTDHKRRSAQLPYVQAVNCATGTCSSNLDHLPLDYWDDLDEFGADHTPVGEDDLQRTAIVESLCLKEINEQGDTAAALKRIVTMVGELFQVRHAEISVIGSQQILSLATYIQPGAEQEVNWMDDFKPLKYLNGEAFLSAMPRMSGSVCMYCMTTKESFVGHDLWEDVSFEYLKQLDLFRFYAGAPIFVRGVPIGTICLLDKDSRPDFSKANEIQLEQCAHLIAQQIENWSLRREMKSLEERRLTAVKEKNKALRPEGNACIVCSDVQNSTWLWESEPDAMQRAIEIHDRVLRKALHNNNGYEIKTEGDSFEIAFHDIVDAVRFALEGQEALHDAPWDDALLTLSDALDDEKGFRGLRVRMALHVGPVRHRDNPVSMRREYFGETVNIARSLEGMGHGGQILATTDVWSVASYMAETTLGAPQVVDLGTHVLLTRSSLNEGFVGKGVVQILPSSLAYDFHYRASVDNSRLPQRPGTPRGRRFPPVKSFKQFTPSFHDAPRDGGTVTMAFVYTSEVERLEADSSVLLASLAKLIGALVPSFHGYQCKDFMLAFGKVADAVAFGLKLNDVLDEEDVNGVRIAGLLKFGVHEGTFTTMGPHPTSGRADYHGTVVNRAARVAGATDYGKVFVGATLEGEPVLGPGTVCSLVAKRRLKGVQEDMALFDCTRAPNAS